MTNNEFDLKTTEQVDPSTDITTVGAVLRKAREAKELTVQEVALKLHLRPGVITDLENDKFDAMSSETYVRGYIKNYARFIEADIALIKTCVMQQLPQDPEPIMQSFSRKTTKQARDKRLLISTYFILFVLLALLVLWWVQKSSSLDGVDVSQPSVEEVAATQDDLINEASFGRYDGSPAGHETETQGATFDELSDSAALAATDLAGLETLESADATQVISQNDIQDGVQSVAQNSAQSNEPQISGSQITAPLATEVPVTSVDKSVPAIAGLEQLQLQTSADCWVNVVDATGKVLIDGVKLAGYVNTVNGKAPLKVILGAPTVVTLTLNGQNVDLTEYLDGRVARLTLPQS
jgi:cytoskeleton protein RodZ